MFDVGMANDSQPFCPTTLVCDQALMVCLAVDAKLHQNTWPKKLHMCINCETVFKGFPMSVIYTNLVCKSIDIQSSPFRNISVGFPAAFWVSFAARFGLILTTSQSVPICKEFLTFLEPFSVLAIPIKTSTLRCFSKTIQSNGHWQFELLAFLPTRNNMHWGTLTPLSD